MTLTDSAATTPRPYMSIRPPKGWIALRLREIWQFRDLVIALASRDLKLRYKQTALGVVWVVLQPLMGAGILSFVFGTIAKMDTDHVPNFLFTYSGFLAWNLYNSTVTRASGCLVGNANLISKIFFPRLVLPVSVVPSVLVDFAVALVMMFVMLLIHPMHMGWQIALLPVWVLLLLMAAIGLGLITAALSVTYRDVNYILPVFLQMLFFASPVAYAINNNKNAWWWPYYNLNPMVSLLMGFRRSLLPTSDPSAGGVIYSVAISIATLLIGVVMFKQMERKFADVI